MMKYKFQLYYLLWKPPNNEQCVCGSRWMNLIFIYYLFEYSLSPPHFDIPII